MPIHVLTYIEKLNGYIIEIQVKADCILINQTLLFNIFPFIMLLTVPASF